MLSRVRHTTKSKCPPVLNVLLSLNKGTLIICKKVEDISDDGYDSDGEIRNLFDVGDLEDI